MLVGACWSAPRGLGSHGEFEGLGMEGSSITQKKIKILEDGYILCGEKCCRFVSSLGCFGLVGEEL